MTAPQMSEMKTWLKTWCVPQWPAAANVKAVCTSRAGGVSISPYDALNLGLHVGDRAQDVLTNRSLLGDYLGAQPVFMDQVHGWSTLELTQSHRQAGVPPRADACVTRETGLACTVMVADCLPVLMCSGDGQLVAAAHAGWRGLLGQDGVGVLESTVEGLRHAAPGYTHKDWLVWLGPCIGPSAFEVGGEVRDAYAQSGESALKAFAPLGGGKWLADLAYLARDRLGRMGIEQIYGNDGSPAWCTFSNPERYFSHRRDRVSGRLAAAIWRVA